MEIMGSSYIDDIYFWVLCEFLVAGMQVTGREFPGKIIDVFSTARSKGSSFFPLHVSQIGGKFPGNSAAT